MPEVNRVKSMGQLVKFPDSHTEQIALTPGLGRNTEPGKITGKSTNMINALKRLLHNQKSPPDSVYYSDVETLTNLGDLIVALMDKVGKSVRFKYI